MTLECLAASGFEEYPKWAGAMKKVHVLQRHNGKGSLVEWTMGILSFLDRPVFAYSYDRTDTEMTWHITQPSKFMTQLQGR